jgi:hypothetical protein
MEPASIRYKNPGAMWGNAIAIKWGAAKKAVTLNDGKGQGNNIAVFPTYVQGICAQLDLWRSSKNYRNKTFENAIAIWSGHNEVESYIANVLKRVPGMTRKTVMNDAFWKSSMGIAFLKAQAGHEAGKKYPAPDADWIEAQRRVFEEVPEQPSAPVTTDTAVKAARVVGVGTAGVTAASQVVSSITGPVTDTIQQVQQTIDTGGQVVDVSKQVVKIAPDGFWPHALSVVQSPKFLAVALIVVLVAWGLTYYLRTHKDKPA